MADSRAAGILAALRVAARSAESPFLLAVVDPGERERIARALASEGSVEAMGSVKDALARLAEAPIELVVLDPDRERLDIDPVAAAGALSERTEVVLLVDAEPARLGEALGRAVHALLPRPLPESDPLLRAHIRWLVAGRRARARGLAIRAVLGRHRAELESLEPAILGALDAARVAEVPLRVGVDGDAVLAGALDGLNLAQARKVARDAEVLVVGTGVNEDVTQRLAAVRAGAAGAAILVVDFAPTPARATSALYGGARGYLGVEQRGLLGEVALRIGLRRRGEVEGRRLIEALARFAVLDTPEGESASRSVSTIPARSEAAFVPSGHEVLVVDDEIVVLTVLREALRRGGYRVTTARSAEEAIELLKVRAFDVVLTDKNLTGASGLEVLRFTRTLTPPPAAILITGYSSYDSAVEAHEIGALDYIEKPIRDVEVLRQRVRRALNRRDEQLSQTSAPIETTRARVLLVEVEAEKRKLLGEFLSRSFEVISVADGDEALVTLRKDRFDVVLADRNLPGMMGLRVIEQAKKLLPHCASVLYTAYPSFESVKEAFEVGADAFAARPGEDLKALAEKVHGALRSKGGILLG